MLFLFTYIKALLGILKKNYKSEKQNDFADVDADKR